MKDFAIMVRYVRELESSLNKGSLMELSYIEYIVKNANVLE